MEDKDTIPILNISIEEPSVMLGLLGLIVVKMQFSYASNNKSSVNPKHIEIKYEAIKVGPTIRQMHLNTKLMDLWL